MTSPIDMAAIRELEEYGPGIAAEVLTLFVEHLRETLPRIEAAVAAKDPDALHRLAHALKSSSSSVGARQLSAQLRQLEEMGRSGSLAGMEILLSNLQVEAGRVETALLQITSTRKAG